jgi:hypothetical protein
MHTSSDWLPLDISIRDDHTLVKYNHTIRVDLGVWHAPKPYDHIMNWCLEHLGTHTTRWRAFRADFGATLVIQFVDESDATLFALTWSHK